MSKVFTMEGTMTHTEFEQIRAESFAASGYNEDGSNTDSKSVENRNDVPVEECSCNDCLL